MIIHFKNGKTLQISQEIAEIINTRILQGCNKYQTFSDTSGKLVLIVNLEEVVYID